MPDRNKVIKGVWQCWLPSTDEEYETQCHDCPYYEPNGTLEERMTALRKDAVELLKEQQGHDGSFIVVDTHTGKEADVYNIALHEDWAKHLCYCDMDGWAIQDDGSLLLLDECGRYAYADRERFKVVWDA